jgi:integrase|tara:strand:+ start:156 stop:1514 length:1359 start_codon:yes stop_codon:yes gene_type:complete
MKTKFQKELVTGNTYFRADARRYGGPRRRFKTIKECEAFIKEWQKFSEEGVSLDASNVSVKEWCQAGKFQYEKEKAANGVNVFILNKDNKRILKFDNDKPCHMRDLYSRYLDGNISYNTLRQHNDAMLWLEEVARKTDRMIDANPQALSKKLYEKAKRRTRNVGGTDISNGRAWGTYRKYMGNIVTAFKNFEVEYKATTLIHTHRFIEEPTGRNDLKKAKSKSYDLEQVNEFFEEMFDDVHGYSRGIRSHGDISDKMTESLKMQIAVLIAAGLRRGEYIALTWDDLKLRDDAYYLEITKIYNKGTNQLQSHMKNKKEIRREVPLPASIAERLLNYKAMLNETDLKNNLMFPNTQGNLDKRCRLYKSMNNANKRVFGSRKTNGHQWLNIHDLRHICATNYIRAGASLTETKNLLGHTSEDTTERLYISEFKQTADELKAKNKYQSVVFVADTA